VAAPRELVDSRVQALEQAGVEPIAIELEPFALIRGVIDLPSHLHPTQETLAIVDIGASSTQITIITAGSFGLTRSVSTAGNNFTEAIAKVLGVALDQAERVKEDEVQIVSDEASRALLSPVAQEASRSLESILEELVREIRRSFAFYDYQQGPTGEERHPLAKISRVIITGGSAKLGGWPSFLQDQLGIPVELVDIFQHGLIKLPDGSDSLLLQMPLLATVVGLALREPMLSHEKGGSR
jgi:type IV pilus assembly protein PilM